MHKADPAFPHPQAELRRIGQPDSMAGVSLLEYFAIKALPVVASRYYTDKDDPTYVPPESYRSLARDAYALAHAMIEEGKHAHSL